MAQMRLGTVTNFTLTSSAQQSAAFGSQTRSVLVSSVSTGIGMGGAFILFGDNTGVIATSTNGTFFPPGWMWAFDVTPGQRVSVIEGTTSHGTISVTELA